MKVSCLDKFVIDQKTQECNWPFVPMRPRPQNKLGRRPKGEMLLRQRIEEAGTCPIRRAALADKAREVIASAPAHFAKVDPYWIAEALRRPSQEDADTLRIYKERLHILCDAVSSTYEAHGLPPEISYPTLDYARRVAAESLGMTPADIQRLLPIPGETIDPTKKREEKNFSPSQNFSLAKGGEPG